MNSCALLWCIYLISFGAKVSQETIHNVFVVPLTFMCCPMADKALRTSQIMSGEGKRRVVELLQILLVQVLLLMQEEN